MMLQTWEPNAKVVLVRNPNYRTPPARDAIQRMVYLYIAEPGTLRQQLAGGDIDLAEELTPAILEPLKTTQGVIVHTDIANGAGFGQPVVMNLQKKPFDNPSFRRAMAYAINYDRLASVWNGIAEPAQGFLPNTFTPWFSGSDAVQYKQDLTKAAAELKAAGYSMPISPALKLPILWQAGNTAQRDMAQLMKEDLAKLGIDLDIQEKEITVWRDALWKHTFDLAFIGLPLRYSDPDSIASLILISTEYRDRGFNPGILDKNVDDLILKGRSTAQLEQRRPLYNQLQKVITQDAMILFTVNTKYAWGSRTNVQNLTWNPNYGPYWQADVIKKGPLK
jgi:peptide/nickel transport system substrate-binding protein